jgi:hypothetical protein
MKSASPEIEPLDPGNSVDPPDADKPLWTEPNSRPSIIHFLVWTACTGIVLAVEKVSRSGSPLPFFVLTLVSAMLDGAALGVLAMTLFRRWRRQRFPTQPGEWFLLAYASGKLLQRIFVYVLSSLASLQGPLDWDWVLLGAFTLFVLPFVFALIYGGGGVNWRVVFFVLLLLNSLYVLQEAIALFKGDAKYLPYTGMLAWPFKAKPYVWLIVAGASIGIDIARKMDRGWIHNVGAAVLMLLPCLELAQRFVWSNFRLP